MIALAALLLALTACSARKVEDPATSPLYYFNRGNEAYQREDYPRAVRMYKQAVGLDEHSPVVFYNLGLAYQMLEAYPESSQAYNRALKLDPNLAEAHMNLALVYDRLYDLEQAQSHYDAYLVLVRAAADPAPKDGTAATSAAAATAAKAPSARANLPGAAIDSLPGGKLAQARAPQVIQPAPPKRVPQVRPRPLAGTTGRGQTASPGAASRGSVVGGPGGALEPTSETSSPWWTQDLPARNP